MKRYHEHTNALRENPFTFGLLLALLFPLITLHATLVLAVDEPALSDKPAFAEPLAAKEQLVRDRMMQLEDRMYRLSDKLAHTEPQQAKKLEVALRQARELLI